MLTASTTVVEIKYDNSLHIVHYQWVTPPTSSEFREEMSKGIAIVNEIKATKWLGDVRELGAINSDDQEWVNTFWFPEVLKAGITKMAIIIGDDIFNQMSVEDIMSRVDGTEFESQYFPNSDDAIKWLNNN